MHIFILYVNERVFLFVCVCVSVHLHCTRSGVFLMEQNCYEKYSKKKIGEKKKTMVVKMRKTNSHCLHENASISSARWQSAKNLFTNFNAQLKNTHTQAQLVS